MEDLVCVLDAYMIAQMATPPFRPRSQRSFLIWCNSGEQPSLLTLLAALCHVVEEANLDELGMHWHNPLRRFGLQSTSRFGIAGEPHQRNAHVAILANVRHAEARVFC